MNIINTQCRESVSNEVRIMIFVLPWLYFTLPWLYSSPLILTLIHSTIVPQLHFTDPIHHSTMALLHSTWFYFTQSWLYFTLPYITLLHSTSFCYGSSSPYLTLLDSTSFYHGSTPLYHGSAYLYLTLLPSTMALLHSIIIILHSTMFYSTWLYHGSTITILHSNFTLLCSTLHYPTLALLHSTSLYFILPWLYIILYLNFTKLQWILCIFKFLRGFSYILRLPLITNITCLPRAGIHIRPQNRWIASSPARAKNESPGPQHRRPPRQD